MSDTGELTKSFARANEELAASFRRYLEARGLSPATIRSYHHETVSYLVEFCGSRSIIDEADRTLLREFLADLAARGVSAIVLRRHVHGLRTFFKFLVFSRLIKINPAYQLSLPKQGRQLPRVLTVAEVEVLIGATETPFERAIIEVLYATGIRIGELVKIRIENVDFAEQVIRVVKGKGGKDGEVPFGSHAAKAMRDYLDSRSEGFLFESDFVVDEPYSTHYVSSVVRDLGHRAGLGRVTPHMLRRACACHMLAAGANLRYVQTLLRHERISTTSLYTDLTVEQLKAVHDRAHPHAQDGGSL